MPLPQEPEEGAPVERDLYDRPSPSVFEALDPETVQPTSHVPPSSSDAPVGDTSGEDGEPQGAKPDEPQDHTEAPDEEPQPLPEFDPRWRSEFEGLLFLGALKSTFRLWGHTFVIRTLTTEDMAEIALLVKPYEGTRASVTAYQAAVVAAAILSVDGQPLPTPIVMGEAPLELRYKYVSSKWYPPIREAIYEKVLEQEITVREVLAEMGKAFG